MNHPDTAISEAAPSPPHAELAEAGVDDASAGLLLPPCERTTQHPPAPLIHVATSLVGILGPFVGVIAAMIVSWRRGWLDWTQISILVSGLILTGLGLTLGYHRLVTHRAFSTYPWVRGFWIILGALGLQKSPLEWCATHRKHHALSDQPGDPHSPHVDFHEPGFVNTLKGFWHAHVGWIFTGNLLATDQKRYVPDLLQDPFVMWIHRYWEIGFAPLTFLIPTGVAWAITRTGEGALLGFLWGGCVRVFLVQHITFSVNSICHMLGSRDFASDDHSRNNLICGLLSAGEGFHNNHHAFPTSARHGLSWREPDLTWAVIRLMELTGLAWDVKLPTEQQQLKKRLPPPGRKIAR